MKLTNKTATKLKPGMTLIEITVVILVLLTLISVLFIGANIYKKGADRAACILNIRNIHQAVRANQNMQAKNIGTDDLVRTDIIGANAYLEAEPQCPTSSQIAAAIPAVDEVPESAPGAGDGTPAQAAVPAVYDYTMTAQYPAVGTVATTCDQFAADLGHAPSDVSGW